MGAPSGASIDPVTGAFSWTPTEAQGPGAFSFTVRVSDAGGLFDDETVTVTGGNRTAGNNQLGALINELEALERSGRLDPGLNDRAKDQPPD